ncbi:MAG: hypothetical protein R3272_02865 [Candidatus Promineifilaceae bacterium]|nr:hypothetical protein [Candidatus Promineifilaceae bacterium]
MLKKRMNRREFLLMGAASSSALILAACGLGAEEEETAAQAEVVEVDTGREVDEPQIIVGDVEDFALTSDEWAGAFGFVTFRLNEGRVDGEPVYFIRTDTSERAFADENGLVYVPLLNAAARGDFVNRLYLFDDERLPVLATSPADEDFISLFRIVRVSGGDDDLSSAQAVEAAASAGRVTLEETPILVNYPVVKWPGGEMAVDSARDSYLGTGQLLEPVDTAGMTVIFKLHECFPGSRYIITDTSAVPMAPMMSIPASAPSQQLMELGGTDEIWVFANGIPGSGVMGFQPAIFDSTAGAGAWSPFWNHFTWRWTDEGNARLLRSSAEGREAEAAGELELFNGTPNSHPNGFVVNCPVPILAPNTFQG